LAQSQEWDKDFFSSYNAQYNRINSVIGTLQILQVGLYIMIGIFLFSIAIIIYSIIGNFIYYYRDEIYITRLVGGSKLFIYGPFGIQGAIYSVVSYSVSVILFFFLLKSIDAVLPAGLSDSGVIQNFATIFLIQLCISGLIWGMSGFVSSRKYLK
jgi:cell division protein FtsX